MKRRIWKLKAPYFLEIQVTRAELITIAKALGLEVAFDDIGYEVLKEGKVTNNATINRGAGMMAADGALEWRWHTGGAKAERERCARLCDEVEDSALSPHEAEVARRIAYEIRKAD